MKFRKKPVIIEAMEYTDQNLMNLMFWISKYQPKPENGEDSVKRLAYENENGELMIHTLEGDMKANKTDWIIKGVQNEFYPCKADIFAATYESVSDLPEKA